MYTMTIRKNIIWENVAILVAVLGYVSCQANEILQNDPLTLKDLYDLRYENITRSGSNSNLDELLYAAARDGDAARVRLLAKIGASVEYKNSKNNRPIHVATENSHTGVLQVLLNWKADPNTHGEYGYTALHWTSYNGCLECARILLERGADVDSRDNWKDTPLVKSSKYGYYELDKLLLDKGADVNAVQESNISSLHMAAQQGWANVVELLLKHGADVNLLNNNRDTALSIAANNGRAEVINLLKAKVG